MICMIQIIRNERAVLWQPLIWGAILALTSVASLAAPAQSPKPGEVLKALHNAQVPREAMSWVVQEVGKPTATSRWQAELAVNQASLFKLVTTYAALDTLGPAWSWSTPVWLQGRLTGPDVFEGDLIIKGSGDPKLVQERLWLLLRRVQQMGVREIRGDIVLDNSAFVIEPRSPADFDGEPTRPGNALPDALMLNQKSLLLSFTPDIAHGLARVSSDTHLAGVTISASVPLLTGPCTDWRSALKATLNDATRIHFSGGYIASCGEQRWPLAYVDPTSFNARLIESQWRELGGRLSGTVRAGLAPIDIKPTLEFSSPALADVVRDINKYSNNVMAQQLFLTLALQSSAGAPASEPDARAVLRDWLGKKLSGVDLQSIVIDNGSGLSRQTRISASVLAQLLLTAWGSPVMPELIASLPLAGLDGTTTRDSARFGKALAKAHLKTGSLRDVVAVAGYVLAESGRRYVVVGIINHANAGNARGALDALVRWTALDAP